MATKYTAFIWPPLIFPLPVFLGGGKYALFTPSSWPPMALPLPLAARTAKQGATTSQQAVMPPLAVPASPSQAQTWSAAPQPVGLGNPANRVNPYTTQDQISSFFRIQSPRPGSGT